MKKIIMIILPMIVLSTPCKAQSDIDNLFSLDLAYAFTGILNQGWGIGINYEKKLFDFLSIKGNLGHMTFSTGIKNVYNTSVSLSLFVNYYPLSSGLDKLYIGVGNGCDFMNYFGSGELPPDGQDTLVHITPQLGWKFHVLHFLMIDVSTGYKFIVSDTQNYKQIKNYIYTGFRFGLGLNILFSEILKK